MKLPGLDSNQGAPSKGRHYGSTRLKQLQELSHREPCAMDDRGQGPCVYASVRWDHYLREGFVSPQNDVASLLPLEVETCPS